MGFVRSGTKVALALLGVDEEEAKSEAKRLGISLYEQLWIEAAKKIAINPIFDVVNFAQKAKEAGEFFGRKFTLGYLKVTLKMFSDNPIMKFFYEQVTGSSLEADIRKYQKTQLSLPKVQRLIGRFGSVTTQAHLTDTTVSSLSRVSLMRSSTRVQLTQLPK